MCFHVQRGTCILGSGICRYGAFIPNERAYYNVSTPRAHTRRPSSEQLREYRRNNVTGGIDTHRSDVSFGKTTESVRGGREGEPRAREATKSLTSGEVSWQSILVRFRVRQRIGGTLVLNGHVLMVKVEVLSSAYQHVRVVGIWQPWQQVPLTLHMFHATLFVYHTGWSSKQL